MLTSESTLNALISANAFDEDALDEDDAAPDDEASSDDDSEYEQLVKSARHKNAETRMPKMRRFCKPCRLRKKICR